MYNKALEKMILEASLDEIYVHFVAENAMTSLGILENEFNTFVDEYNTKNYVTVEPEEYIYIETRKITSFLFKNTDKTIERLNNLNNT